MTYEKLLGLIADEVLNEYWKNGNDYTEPSLDVYESYMEKRQPEIERLLKAKQFDSVGIDGEIAKCLVILWIIIRKIKSVRNTK